MAKVLARALEPHQLLFIEEPVLSENYEAIRDIVSAAAIPIALGERLFSRWDFKRILADGLGRCHPARFIACWWDYRMQKNRAVWPKPTTSRWRPHCPLGRLR
jgi:hypothetical protein